MIKGHGTGNDFLLYADAEGTAPLTSDQVTALTDRHRGLGADGVIRAVRSEHHPEAPAGTEWFMDYVNADGTPAEMCGNGIRVFAAFLEHEGLLRLADGESVAIGTRAGAIPVRREDQQYAADMGAWSAPGGADALAQGFDVTVAVHGLIEPRPGLRIDMPNPHVVVVLADRGELEMLDLDPTPRVEPEPENGTNVEFVVPLGEKDVELVDETGQVVGTERVGVIQLRVHERGVGETLSCGTGACAAAMAVRTWFGADAPREWVVLVPGGQLRVRVLEGERIELAGPAELVAQVQPLA